MLTLAWYRKVCTSIVSTLQIALTVHGITEGVTRRKGQCCCLRVISPNHLGLTSIIHQYMDDDFGIGMSCNVPPPSPPHNWFASPLGESTYNYIQERSMGWRGGGGIPVGDQNSEICFYLHNRYKKEDSSHVEILEVCWLLSFSVFLKNKSRFCWWILFVLGRSCHAEQDLYNIFSCYPRLCWCGAGAVDLLLHLQLAEKQAARQEPQLQILTNVSYV